MKLYLKTNKLLLLLIFLMGMVVAFGTVYLAIILQDIVNIATRGDAESFTIALVKASIYLVLLGICKYVYSVLEKIVIKRITNKIRTDIFYSAMNKELCIYAEEDTGSYISTLTNDLKIIEENYLLPLFKIMENIVLFIFSVVAILQISPEVLFTLIACVIGMTGISAFFGRILQNRQDTFSKQIGEYTVKIKELLGGYELFTYYNETPNVIDEHDAFNSKLTHTKFLLDFFMAINQTTSDMLGLLTMFLVVVIGAYKVISGSVLVGTLVALVQLSNSFVNPIMEITMNIPKMQSTKKIVKKIRDLCDSSSEKRTQLLSFREYIEYRDVWFSYDDKNYALKGINLVFEKGKKYLIIGDSGCGKSTLIGVLLGKCRPYKGIVRCDSNDLEDCEITNLCAVIQQNVYILNRSIKENIELYKEFSDEEIEEVLTACGLNNLDINKCSMDLSGGQKQRISIARAIIRKKPILIIDEGTSAVDTITSNEIEKKLLEDKNTTIITISHKLNSELMKKYDQIIYLEQGSIIEHGNYDELIKRQGKVYAVLQLQQK